MSFPVIPINAVAAAAAFMVASIQIGMVTVSVPPGAVKQLCTVSTIGVMVSIMSRE